MKGESVNQAVDVLTSYGLRVLGGVLILIAGWMAAKWVANFTRRQLKKSETVDDTLTEFISDLIKYKPHETGSKSRFPVHTEFIFSVIQ